MDPPSEGASAPEPARKSRAAHLVRTIEGEIIPRLMLAHQHPGPHGQTGDSTRSGTTDDAVEMARLSVAHDLALARSFVESLRIDGVRLESVFLDVLAPAARLLGDLWLRDRCRFTDVTVGLCHLQQLARELGPDFEREGAPQGAGPLVALAPAPGEQHVFGLVLLEHFCRRDGFNVWTSGCCSQFDLLRLAETEWLALVGLSVSNDGLLERLRSFIADLRQTSMNPELSVMVGGGCVTEHADLASRVGADAAPADLRATVAYMERHLASVAGARSR